jgi:hypothetical protein
MSLDDHPAYHGDNEDSAWPENGQKNGQQETSMDAHTNTMLIIVVTGVALMLVGFGLRDRNLGMGLMGVGLITALGTILYKAYITFY